MIVRRGIVLFVFVAVHPHSNVLDASKTLFPEHFSMYFFMYDKLFDCS